MSRVTIFAQLVLCTAAVSALGARAQETEDVTIEVRDGFRHIKATGMPNHPVGVFTSRNSVLTLQPQNYNFRVPVEPRAQRRATAADRGVFGIALNGVVFDGRPEQHWNERSSSGWAYDTMRNAKALEIDQNNGHAQRGGAYHYHGVPIGMINKLPVTGKMRLIGWAADGFPIYDQFGHEDPNDPESRLVRLQPSYRVKAGGRATSPFGPYDGTFVQDWHYEQGFGDLDECNGRTGVTPEFPKGTYYYVITHLYPSVPRFFRGTPDQSFLRRGRGRDEW